MYNSSTNENLHMLINFNGKYKKWFTIESIKGGHLVLKIKINIIITNEMVIEQNKLKYMKIY